MTSKAIDEREPVDLRKGIYALSDYCVGRHFIGNPEEPGSGWLVSTGYALDTRRYQTTIFKSTDDPDPPLHEEVGSRDYGTREDAEQGHNEEVARLCEGDRPWPLDIDDIEDSEPY